MSASMDFESMTRGLQRTLGWSRERAEAEARRQLRIEIPAEPTKDDRILESKEQHEIMKQFAAFGFHVYNLSQARASKQTPGLADLWCAHRVLPIAFWWESKRQVGGVHSPAQLDFAEELRRCGVGYGTGDRYAAAQHLIDLGLAVRIGDTLEPSPRLRQARAAAESALIPSPTPCPVP